MIKFDYDKIIRERVAIHCDTKEKANNLLEWVGLNDLKWWKWCVGKSYLKYNNWFWFWFVYKEKTCYNLYTGEYDYYDNYKKNNYTILKYEDVIMEENKSIEDGWYYIKLNQSEKIENLLPPTRCVYVKNNKAMAHDSFYCAGNNMFDVTEEMIQSSAYYIGKEYEFSDNKKDWRRDIYVVYTGYDTDSGYPHQSQTTVWDYVREIKEPDIEITVKIKGKEVKLSEISEETLLKVRQNS